MDVKVLLSSGETDEWEEVADTVEQQGSLFVVDQITDDPEKQKVLVIEGPVPEWREAPGGGWEMRSGEDDGVLFYEVLAQYAPGMWMKVEYNQ